VSFTEGSIYDLPPAGDTALRVLIMRQWPRGVRKDRVDVWLKDASPSRDLLDAYHHHGLAWDEFEARYRSEIKNERPEVLQQLRNLEKEHGTVRLLCFERIPPHEHCHRFTLLEMLRG
jgi:uncharacterized protein YeaO (DUF488 family)